MHFCFIENGILLYKIEYKIQLHSRSYPCFRELPAKKAGGGAPCGRAEGVHIAMGIRVFGVRGSNGTSTEKGIPVAFLGFSFRNPGGRDLEKQEE